MACRFCSSLLATLAADANGTEKSPTAEATTEEIAELKHKVAAVYDRVRAAIVRADGNQGCMSGGEIGVIVSKDGLVLLLASLTHMVLTFRLDDGRDVAGTALDWSDEYGIGMAKLDGAGSWPYVDLTNVPCPLLGQAVVTFTIPVAESTTIAPHPLLAVDWIERSAPGLWFMTSGSRPFTWHRTLVAFDLDRRLVGVMGKQWATQRIAGQSPRRSGFRRALSVAAPAERGLYGGPVVDDQGQAPGVAIAWREKGWLCVLPASEVASFLPK